MFDFTLTTYNHLLNNLSNQGFSFLTFSEFLSGSTSKVIMLRHDVDKLPDYSLKFATTQAELGIMGTYYFRAVPGLWDERIIKKIANFGHEIGYHYEDLSFAWAKLKAQGTGHKAQEEELEREIVEIGLQSFKKNLEQLRNIVPIKTICMHGSPMSKWDSRLLWKYYNYRDFGILGEPYFDIDFNEVMYLTDTGRCWDGDSVNIRDKAQGTGLRAQGKDNPAPSTEQLEAKRRSRLCGAAPFPHFQSTFDIIKAAEQGKLPDKSMMTFHPQRWTDRPGPWVKELLWQNTKNAVKYFYVKNRNQKL
jgi:hypothetical protein